MAGNVRELRNVIEQACLMCPRDTIEEADLNLRELRPLVREPTLAGHGHRRPRRVRRAWPTSNAR
jgi:DNA-binding NtrC family response regulator